MRFWYRSTRRAKSLIPAYIRRALVSCVCLLAVAPLRSRIERAVKKKKDREGRKRSFPSLLPSNHEFFWPSLIHFFPQLFVSPVRKTANLLVFFFLPLFLSLPCRRIQLPPSPFSSCHDASHAGFVTREDGGGDVFVHQSDIHSEGFRSLRDQEPVEFELEEIGNGRYKAVKAGFLVSFFCLRKITMFKF